MKRSRHTRSAGGALENVRRERAGLDAQLPPVVQPAADLLEPIAKRGDDRLLLGIGALLDAEPRGESGVGETAVADPAAALEPRDGALHGIRCPAAGGGVRQ